MLDSVGVSSVCCGSISAAREIFANGSFPYYAVAGLVCTE